MKIGIIGYGIVGQTATNGFAKKGCYVFWNDIKKELSVYSKRQIMEVCDYIFICVDTPYRNNQPDMGNIYDVCEDLVQYIHLGNPPILLKSTMVPGTTDDLSRLYPELTFVVNPEFLREQTALQDFLHPDRIVIGTYDTELALTLYHKLFYHFVVPAKYCVVSPTAAELIKLLSNIFLTTKVAFANLVNEIAQHIDFPADVIMEAVTLDHRFNPSHMTPSKGKISADSLCLPKDVLISRDYLLNIGIMSTFLDEVYRLAVEASE